MVSDRHRIFDHLVTGRAVMQDDLSKSLFDVMRGQCGWIDTPSSTIAQAVKLLAERMGEHWESARKEYGGYWDALHNFAAATNRRQQLELLDGLIADLNPESEASNG